MKERATNNRKIVIWRHKMLEQNRSAEFCKIMMQCHSQSITLFLNLEIYVIWYRLSIVKLVFCWNQVQSTVNCHSKEKMCSSWLAKLQFRYNNLSLITYVDSVYLRLKIWIWNCKRKKSKKGWKFLDPEFQKTSDKRCLFLSIVGFSCRSLQNKSTNLYFKSLRLKLTTNTRHTKKISGKFTRTGFSYSEVQAKFRCKSTWTNHTWSVLQVNF